MVTLNIARDILINFFKRHKQINTVIYSDYLDFEINPNIIYRVAHIEPLDSNINKNNIIYNFKIVIGDRQNPNNKESENEIYNDTIQIAEDFITYFEEEIFDDNEDVVINENINIQRFTESNTDRISGVVFNVNLTAQRLKNKCAIPFNPIPNEIIVNDEFPYEFPFDFNNNNLI